MCYKLPRQKYPRNLQTNFRTNRETFLLNENKSRRITITAFLICFMYFVETTVPIPGVDQSLLMGNSSAFNDTSVVGIERYSIVGHLFTLGISPFITSNVVIRTLVFLHKSKPEFKAVINGVPFLSTAVNDFLSAKEEGKAGEGRSRRSIRRFAIPCMVLEAIYYSSYILTKETDHLIFDWPFDWPLISPLIYTSLTLITGSCIVERIANDISDWGLGDGFLTIISFEIVMTFCHSLFDFVRILMSNETSAGFSCILIASFLLFVFLSVWLNIASDSVPLSYYKSRTKTKTKFIGYNLKAKLPLKWLPQGIFPLFLSNIIITAIPSVFQSLSPKKEYAIFSNHFFLPVVSGILVCFLQSFVYVGVGPEEMLEQMNHSGARIAGLRPGAETLVELKKRTRRACFKGGLSLGFCVFCSKILDLNLFHNKGIKLSINGLFLFVCLAVQIKRQFTALSKEK